MKVINLTTGGLTDVRKLFSEARLTIADEKSAEAIVGRSKSRKTEEKLKG
jgi:hypothetical protein